MFGSVWIFKVRCVIFRRMMELSIRWMVLIIASREKARKIVVGVVVVVVAVVVVVVVVVVVAIVSVVVMIVIYSYSGRLLQGISLTYLFLFLF